MQKVIVSSHPAAVQFIAIQLHGSVKADGSAVMLGGFVASEPLEEILVIASATVDDVAGKVVYGNLTYTLAKHAHRVFAIEFTGTPPRGQEYGLQEMLDAGALLAEYRVFSVEQLAKIVDDVNRTSSFGGYVDLKL